MNQPVAYAPGPYEKPGMVTAITIMTLIDGILNTLWFLGGVCSAVLTVLGTLGIGLVCAPCFIIFIYPLVLGILEIIYAVKLLSNPPKPVQPAKYLAIMEICNILTGNIISLIVGILALIFYNDRQVQTYFAQLNASVPAS